MRVRDYDPPEFVHYRNSRFPDYGPLTRDFSLEQFENDFQDDYDFESSRFAKNQEYRPLGREFAASQTWQDSQFKYEKLRNLEDRNLPFANSKWFFRQSSKDTKPWLPWRKPWKGDYWSRLESEDYDEEDSLEKSWRQYQRHHQQPWKSEATSSWSGDKNLQVSFYKNSTF